MRSRQSSKLWAPIPLRLIVGCGFIQHGYAKLTRGPDAFAAILQQLGVPLPHLASWLTISTEVLGGLAVLLGAFLVWASIPMSIVLLTAAISVHWRYGFSSIKLISISSSGVNFGPVGYEVDLLYLASLAALVMLGPGPLSLARFSKRFETGKNKAPVTEIVQLRGWGLHVRDRYNDRAFEKTL